MIFIVFRNLTLALFLLRTLFSNGTEGASVNTKLHQDAIFVTGDFQVSKVFLLSSCFLLNHWFINILGVIGLNGFFLRFATLENSACNCTKYTLLSCYLWCANFDREPPDKFPDKTPFTHRFHHYIYKMLYILLRILFNKFLQRRLISLFGQAFFWHNYL